MNYITHQVSLSMGYSRQEHWSGLLFPSPGDIPDPGIEPASPALAARFSTAEPPGCSLKVKVKALSRFQFVLTPWTVTSVHGILQAGILEWVAISFSMGSFQPRDETGVSHIAGRRFTI